MTALLTAVNSVTTELEIEFPNLFNGTAISYYRGFELFGISIYWYGVLITLGVILGYTYAHMRCKQFGLDKERMFDVVFAALIGGFLGARIYYCVFTTLDPNSGKDYNFITMFTTIRDGGLAIYGGIIGAFLVGIVMCKLRKVNIRAMFDMASLGFLIGQCIGRWGNFVNQEAYGAVAPEGYLLGMTGTIISSKVEAGAVVHPCFLYESMWCLLGFVLLHFYSKKLRTYDGEIFLLYIAWYGLGRAFIEGLRTDSLMIGATDIRVSQVIAAVTFVVAVVLFIVFKILTEKKNIPLWVNSEGWTEMQEQYRLEEENKTAKKKAKENEQAESILAADADDIDEISDDEVTDEDEADEVTEEQDHAPEEEINEDINENDNESEDN
ncbi:MAG: prolipoprotein diacylglyceryl transferase [Oscillospiraceae bacterium]|nr:prolipoprotein diacylglyceryl transferase [Oscillospiraceae bacterium]